MKELFPEHDTQTTHEMGWDQSLDGELLRLAEHRFDVLVTIDRKLEHQQNIRSFDIGVLVVSIRKNQFRHYLACQAPILAALDRVRPGEIAHVDCIC